VVTWQQPLGFTTPKLLRQLRQSVPDEYFRASGLHARERVLDYSDYRRHELNRMLVAFL